VAGKDYYAVLLTRIMPLLKRSLKRLVRPMKSSVMPKNVKNMIPMGKLFSNREGGFMDIPVLDPMVLI
jgi:hypothetical protein